MSARDPFKTRLRRRDVMFGCFVGQPSPAIVEMVGYAGFDYVIIDLEHGPTGLEMLENMLRAAQAAGAASLVRMPSPAPADVLRVLDAGADGILVPRVESVADAQAIVAHAYPPAGQPASTRCRARRSARSSARRSPGGNARTSCDGQLAGGCARPDVALDGIDGIFVGGTIASAPAISATATIRTCRRRSGHRAARAAARCALATTAVSDRRDRMPRRASPW